MEFLNGLTIDLRICNLDPQVSRVSSDEVSFSFKKSPHQNNKVCFGNVGNGNDLLSVNVVDRIIAVGCVNGVYLIPAFDLHLLFLCGSGYKFDFSKKARPTVLVNNPLQIMLPIEECGNKFLAIRSSEGLYLIRYSTSPIRVSVTRFLSGEFETFDISRKGRIGLLSRPKNELLVYHDYSDEPEGPISPLFRTTSFSFFEKEDKLVAGNDRGAVLLYNCERREIMTYIIAPPSWMPKFNVDLHVLTSESIFTFIRRYDDCVTSVMGYHEEKRDNDSTSIISDKYVTLFSTETLNLNGNHNNYRLQNTNPEKKHVKKRFVKYLKHFDLVLIGNDLTNRLQLFYRTSDDDWVTLQSSSSTTDNDDDDDQDDDDNNINRTEPKFFSSSRETMRGLCLDYTLRIPSYLGARLHPSLFLYSSNGSLELNSIICSGEDYEYFGFQQYPLLTRFSGGKSEEIEYKKQFKRLYLLQISFKKEKVKAFEQVFERIRACGSLDIGLQVMKKKLESERRIFLFGNEKSVNDINLGFEDDGGEESMMEFLDDNVQTFGVISSKSCLKGMKRKEYLVWAYKSFFTL